jgi:hypothetical protein
MEVLNKGKGSDSGGSKWWKILSDRKDSVLGNGWKTLKTLFSLSP